MQTLNSNIFEAFFLAVPEIQDVIITQSSDFSLFKRRRLFITNIQLIFHQRLLLTHSWRVDLSPAMTVVVDRTSVAASAEYSSDGNCRPASVHRVFSPVVDLYRAFDRIAPSLVRGWVLHWSLLRHQAMVAASGSSTHSRLQHYPSIPAVEK